MSTQNSDVLVWDRGTNYLYHLAYSLFDNSLTYSEITNRPRATKERSLPELDCGVAKLQ